MSMADPIWTPSPERVAAAQVRNLIERVGVTDFQALHRWSVDHPEAFWRAVWDFVGIRARRQPDRTVEGIDRMPGARWFPGARLNFAENLLRYGDDREALVHWSESGTRRALTFRELRSEVCAVATALERDGVGAGDRVAGFVANVPEAVVAMLATTSLGAIWSSCSPDFGVDAVVDRFGQIRPKVLFAMDSYRYGGRPFDCATKLAQIARRIDSIERLVVVPNLGDGTGKAPVPDATRYADYRRPAGTERFAALPFDHPAYILYSSGTTGVPKCIVHGAGGTLIQHLKELVLHVDLRREDRIFYFTSCGWMMWNWLVSGLAVGATVVLYDGAPFHAGPTALLDMAERERVTVFGTSAKYLSAIQKVGLEPARSHRLDALRTILSTGSPLAPESFDYVYRHVKRDVSLASISGGTDIVSCFALADPTGPVYRGELQTAGLGMRVEVFGDDGQPLPVGRKGELVCTQAFPSMPVGFWNDPDGSRYRTAYFERFPGVWHHGDYCARTERGGFRILGRSDTVLNPGGVRIGTAEIYSAVESMPEVLEAVAVGWETADDEEVALFVRLSAGTPLDSRLVGRIKGRVRQGVSPRHVPKRIFAVDDIPRTRSGKIAELAVRSALHGRPVKNLDSLENPGALDGYARFRETTGDPTAPSAEAGSRSSTRERP